MSTKPKFHLYPPKGWMNDPNGLCQLNGVHHTFFQYSPDNPRGADKYWGHYETSDFINYTYTGITLSPNHPADQNGAFSGSALVEDGCIKLFYTGNVEFGEGERVYEGREGNTITVTTKDGVEHSEKVVVLHERDYPERLSCHVRDPKVWKENDVYYMVLGARTNDDLGLVMLYSSKELKEWKLVRYIEPEEKFGFMWECPDVFCLSGKYFLSLSPQGLQSEEFKFQNPHQSGYFNTEKLQNILESGNEALKIAGKCFAEWDMGFDFYAPQTYMDESGRRILIGWMGGPDVPYDHDPSIDEGWQHMLTVPRELTVGEDGRIKQWPVKEMENLRGEMLWSKAYGNISCACMPELYELCVENIASDLELILDESFKLSYDQESSVISFTYMKNGYGRDVRKIKLGVGEGLRNIRMLVDSCCLEIFINGGMYAFSTKLFYGGGERSLRLAGSFSLARSFSLKPLSINFLKEY